MSARFVIPDWMVPADPPPQPDRAEVDTHHVEAVVNHFIAAKQEALFTAPDAYFRSQGNDAVQRLPDIANRLTGLKDAAIMQPLPDHPRTRSGPNRRPPDHRAAGGRSAYGDGLPHVSPSNKKVRLPRRKR
jgi:hypothetical protein